MKLTSLSNELKAAEYHGRGIIVGFSEDKKNAVIAYFIMGRSENSRNRIFEEYENGIRTKAFDETKMQDPSLIIYTAVRVFASKIIVTNGNQTDTIYDGFKNNLSIEQSLKMREFEEDAPNYTPRISAVIDIANNNLNYVFSILKSDEIDKKNCNRFYFSYENQASESCAGTGRYIHTYLGNYSPLQSFEGEPTFVDIRGDIDSFTNNIWQNLNSENKISLFTRFIDISTGKYESRIINKNI